MNITLRHARILLDHTNCDNQFSYQLRGCLKPEPDVGWIRILGTLLVTVVIACMLAFTANNSLFGPTVASYGGPKIFIAIFALILLGLIYSFLIWEMLIEKQEDAFVLPPEMAECISTMGLGPFGKLVIKDDFYIKEHIFVYLASEVRNTHRKTSEWDKHAQWLKLTQLMEKLELLQGWWIAPLWEKGKWKGEYDNLVRDFEGDTIDISAWAKRKAQNANALVPALV